MATAGRAPGGFMDNAYRLLMRRNSVYITFVLTGAIVGEREQSETALDTLNYWRTSVFRHAVNNGKVVDYGINKIWEANNVGKRYEDIPNLGSKAEAAEDE